MYSKITAIEVHVRGLNITHAFFTTLAVYPRPRLQVTVKKGKALNQLTGHSLINGNYVERDIENVVLETTTDTSHEIQIQLRNNWFASGCISKYIYFPFFCSSSYFHIFFTLRYVQISQA